MANSRLERIGTIFSRVEGLLRCNAMRPEDRPIWWDIYRAFPPAREPTFSRPVPQIQLKEIFYEEDLARAQFHKSGSPTGVVNLEDHDTPSNTQKFIKIHESLKSDQLSGEELFAESIKTLKREMGDKNYEKAKTIEQIILTPNENVNDQKLDNSIKNLFD